MRSMLVVLLLIFAVRAVGAEPEKEERIFVSSKAKTFFVAWDPAKWKGDDSCPKEAELCLKHRQLPASVMAGAGPENMALHLRELAASVGSAGLTGPKVAEERRKTVNDTEVLVLRVEGTMDGAPVTTYGYFFAGKQGYVFFMAYIPTHYFAACEPEVTAILDGLHIVK